MIRLVILVYVTAFDTASSHTNNFLFLFCCFCNQFIIKLGSYFTDKFIATVMFFFYNFIADWVFLSVKFFSPN